MFQLSMSNFREPFTDSLLHYYYHRHRHQYYQQQFVHTHKILKKDSTEPDEKVRI